jgi:hypothetical protein
MFELVAYLNSLSVDPATISLNLKTYFIVKGTNRDKVNPAASFYKNITIINDTPRMKIVSDATAWSITYGCQLCS